jgi:hypothetical protein
VKRPNVANEGRITTKVILDEITVGVVVIHQIAVQIFQSSTMEVSTSSGHDGSEIDAVEMFEDVILHQKGKFQKRGYCIRHDELYPKNAPKLDCSANYQLPFGNKKGGNYKSSNGSFTVNLLRIRKKKEKESLLTSV